MARYIVTVTLSVTFDATDDDQAERISRALAYKIEETKLGRDQTRIEFVEAGEPTVQ